VNATLENNAVNVTIVKRSKVSRRTLTAEARVRSRVSPCGIYGGQSGTGIGFPRVLRFSPVNFIRTGAPLLGKMKILIIFITGLHNKS
jgi:hypothetical protein